MCAAALYTLTVMIFTYPLSVDIKNVVMSAKHGERCICLWLPKPQRFEMQKKKNIFVVTLSVKMFLAHILSVKQT